MLTTADGGVGVDGRENLQKVCTKRLLLCEAAAALMCLRAGGAYACKVFGVYSSFSVGLVCVLEKGIPAYYKTPMRRSRSVSTRAVANWTWVA
eukprot:m51a1_g806 putative cg6379-pa (93) ;mRNA; r:665833-666111